jgi:hypothetical protein
MLQAKFDGEITGVPATWIWARLVRMKSTRDGANQHERAGHLIGGYATLLGAMEQRIKAVGGAIHLRRPVSEIMVESGTVKGVRCRDQLHAFTHVVVTMQGPVAARVVPQADEAWRSNLENIPYLGIVCPLMVLDRPLTGTWTVNIADDAVPITGIIETTSYIDPALVGGHHLVYLPKYTAPGSRWLSANDDEIRTVWLEALQRMVPSFDPSWIRYFLVHRERYVEPMRLMGSQLAIPTIQTPVRGLYLATTAQVYPALTNGESVTRHASVAPRGLMATLPRQTLGNGLHRYDRDPVKLKWASAAEQASTPRLRSARPLASGNTVPNGNTAATYSATTGGARRGHIS